MIDQRAPPPALDGVAISEARSSPMGAPSTESGRNLALGILLIVAAFLCVAVMSAFGKAAAAMPTAVISFSQSFIRSEEQRLNSSHLVISYAVFCLKKKKKNTD